MCVWISKHEHWVCQIMFVWRGQCCQLEGEVFALPHISWINEGNFVLDFPSCMLWACTYLLKSPLAVHKDMFPLLVPFLLGLYQGSAKSLWFCPSANEIMTLTHHCVTSKAGNGGPNPAHIQIPLKGVGHPLCNCGRSNRQDTTHWTSSSLDLTLELTQALWVIMEKWYFNWIIKILLIKIFSLVCLVFLWRRHLLWSLNNASY